MTIKLHVEGGGDTREQKARLRRGLRRFLERAGLSGRMPRIVARGDRDRAFDKFRSAYFSQDTVALLLVDAEGPVKAGSPWQHLKARDDWDYPSGARDDQCHLMVQIMESWFLADCETLAQYYGSKFRSSVIPQWPEIEAVPKSDVYNILRQATRDTSKGRYDKGRHSFEILRRLDPEKVVDASPYARRLIDSLRKFSFSS